MRTMLATSIASLMCTAIASAGPMTLSFTDGYSVEGKGHFTGTLAWNYASGNSGTLTITLTNLATTLAGGKITGFGLNGPTTGFSYALTTKPNASWANDTGGVDANPLGTFGFGAALGGDFSGGGSPNNGIHIGDTGTFVYTISNANAASLAALDVLSFWQPNSKGYYGAVRFRGFDGGGSDKITMEQLTVVPLPMTGMLAAGGLAIVGVLRRRMK